MSYENIKQEADTKYDAGICESFLRSVRASYDSQSTTKYPPRTNDAASRFLFSLEIGEYPAAPLKEGSLFGKSDLSGALNIAQNDNPSLAESDRPSTAEASWDLLQLIKQVAKEKPKPVT